jgi:glycosyltransferase involved in cell wall biosynthesis
MNSIQPTCVSIGMPVYNGERFIHEALDSILAQTYPYFELIISDNASSDGTAEICRDYATRDGRIRYHRNEKNLGLSRNFNCVFEMSSGKYFKWAAHDDRLAPEFLAKCVDALDRNPLIVLCEPLGKTISASGTIIGEPRLEPARLSSPHRHIRFGHLMQTDRVSSCEYFGLIRSDILRRTTLIQGYPGGENSLRVELGLQGPFMVIPEYLFYFRDHPDRSYKKHTCLHRAGEWFDIANAGKALYPHWRRLSDYCRCLTRVPMSRWERFMCALKVVQWLLLSLNWARLLTDPIWAHFPGLWEPYCRMKRRFTNN